LVLFDEFTEKFYDECAAQIKKLLSGESFSVDQKCVGTSKRFEWNKPVIILTNENPNLWRDDALLSRLKIVHAAESVIDIRQRHCADHQLSPSKYSEKCVVVEQPKRTVDLAYTLLEKRWQERKQVFDPKFYVNERYLGPPCDQDSDCEQASTVASPIIDVDTAVQVSPMLIGSPCFTNRPKHDVKRRLFVDAVPGSSSTVSSPLQLNTPAVRCTTPLPTVTSGRSDLSYVVVPAGTRIVFVSPVQSSQPPSVSRSDGVLDRDSGVVMSGSLSLYLVLRRVVVAPAVPNSYAVLDTMQ
jgi:hypothetical protein